MKRTVVFILSANYSGSTWLSLLLGSHSKAAYVGELNKMFHDEPVHCRNCEEKGVACPIFHDMQGVKAKHVHRIAFERSQKAVLIDNSKTISWSRKFVPNINFEKKYIHLIRDPRAIAYSLQLRERPIDLEKWVNKNREIQEFLQQYELTSRTVLYNDVAENLDTELSHLCAWLGLEYEPAQKAYWTFEHHGPGRNGATAGFLQNFVASEKSFYDEHKQSNFHDLRWKENLSESTLHAVMGDRQLQQFFHEMGLQFTDTGLKLAKRGIEVERAA